MDTLKFKVSIKLHSKRWVKKNSTWPYFSTITKTMYFYVSLEYIIHFKEYTHWKHMIQWALVNLWGYVAIINIQLKNISIIPQNNLVPCYKQSRYLSTTLRSVQFSSVAQLCPTLWTPWISSPGLPVHHKRPEFIYSNSCSLSRWCHPAISSSVITFSSCPQSNPSQCQGIFQWVN